MISAITDGIRTDDERLIVEQLFCLLNFLECELFLQRTTSTMNICMNQKRKEKIPMKYNYQTQPSLACR